MFSSKPFKLIIIKILWTFLILSQVIDVCSAYTQNQTNSDYDVNDDHEGNLAFDTTEKPHMLLKSTKYQEDLTTKIVTSVFLIISMFDYVVYTLLFVYVFAFVLFQSKTVQKALFTTFIVGMFLVIRSTFFPLMLTVVPWDFVPTLPDIVLTITFYVCTISYIAFFNAPVIACLYFLSKFGLNGNKCKELPIVKGTNESPNIVILMPIYNEDPDALIRAVESVIRSDYDSKKMHLFLSFDDENESHLYLTLLKKLKVLNKQVYMQWKTEIETNKDANSITIFPPRLELLVEDVRLTICRFPHEGKSATQGKSFKLINKVYGNSNQQADNTYIMFIDSDVILHENAVYNFAATMASKSRLKALTGYVTCRTSEKINLLHYLQDAEYLEGQMFARCLEALSGSVTCLPGALTVMRLSAMQEIASKYFVDFNKKRDLNYHRYYLGEDRFMTHLLMEASDRPFTIGLCGSSRCKTDAPDSWLKLMKQRRRWYLGALINETHMLATPRLWRTMPLLLFLKLFDYSSGSLAWLFILYLIGVIKNIVPLWTILVFFPCLFLKYIVLSVCASIMNRTKVFVYFPIFFILAPTFKLVCTIYSIYTWSTRSWGGPRTDLSEKQGNNDDDIINMKLALMKDIMKPNHREINNIKKKVLKQIKNTSRAFNERSRDTLGIETSYSNQTSTTETSIDKENSNDLKVTSTYVSIKNVIPFPYSLELLGGGEFDGDLISKDFRKGSVESLQSNNTESIFINLESQRISNKYLSSKSYEHMDNRGYPRFCLDMKSINRMEPVVRDSASVNGRFRRTESDIFLFSKRVFRTYSTNNEDNTSSSSSGSKSYSSVRESTTNNSF